MKARHFFAAVFFLTGTCFHADAQLQAGGGISYGTEAEAVGIQPRIVYTISEPWRAGADFNYFLDGDEGISYWDLNLNGHYVFYTSEKLSAYALAGLNFFHVSVDNNPSIPGFEDVSDTDTGLNLGAGLQLPLGRLSGLLEARYVLGDADQLVISACVMFPLGSK